jgi:membrane protein implicated in regulation of membrane protease activity
MWQHIKRLLTLLVLALFIISLGFSLWVIGASITYTPAPSGDVGGLGLSILFLFFVGLSTILALLLFAMTKGQKNQPGK